MLLFYDNGSTNNLYLSPEYAFVYAFQLAERSWLDLLVENDALTFFGLFYRQVRRGRATLQQYKLRRDTGNHFTHSNCSLVTTANQGKRSGSLDQIQVGVYLKFAEEYSLQGAAWHSVGTFMYFIQGAKILCSQILSEFLSIYFCLKKLVPIGNCD